MEHITSDVDHLPRIQAMRGLVAILKLLLAAATSVGTVILALTWSVNLGKIARPQPPGRHADSAEIVVDADVKNWETIFSDGPIDPASLDRQINVVDDMVVIGEDNWIIRFKVGKVVSGVFDPNEIRMLVHSPSQFGVEAPGQRFVLHLRRRSERPRVIASSSQRLSEGLSNFTLADRLYELVSDLPR